MERVKASFGRWQSSPNLFAEIPLTGLVPATNERRTFDMLFAYADDAGELVLFLIYRFCSLMWPIQAYRHPSPSHLE